MHIASIATLHALRDLTAPGAPVAPVTEALGAVACDVEQTVRPALVQARASQWMLGEVDRISRAATTLRDSLGELASRDGMSRFDAAFAADDPSWDAWFSESAEVLGRAAAVLDAAAGDHAPTRSTASV